MSICVDRYNAWSTTTSRTRSRPWTSATARHGFDALARDVARLRGEPSPEGGDEELLPRLAAELARIRGLLWGTAE